MSVFDPSSLLLIASLLLTLMGLVFAVLADPYVKRVHRIVMMIIITCVMLLIVQNIYEYLLEEFIVNIPARTFVCIIGYTLRPLIMVLFFYIIDDSKDYDSSWILVVTNALFHFTAFFSGLVFTISKDNIFIRGPMGYTCHVVSAILLIQLLHLSFSEYSSLHTTGIIIPVFNAALIVVSVIADSTDLLKGVPVTGLTAAIVMSCVFYYIWLHLQFVQSYEDNVQAEQRIQLMMSQIQPHFLFNTLSTIQALCLIDPGKAADTVGKFGTYLRQNLESIDHTGLIPFEKELDHVKIYASIEMIRFPSIKVEYYIDDSDFSLPALSVQPLVENSIRHGVRSREEGLVIVRAWKDKDAHMITITDNGVGFDVKSAEQSDKSHIGLRNVRERIEKMCGGTLTIRSMIGEGTSVTISIPDVKE